MVIECLMSEITEICGCCELVVHIDIALAPELKCLLARVTFVAIIVTFR